MWYQEYEFVFKQFKKGHRLVDETVFFFRSDPERDEHYIGYCPAESKPYWAGLCDLPDGTEFSTAEKLFEAKIYDGRSIRERWEDLVFESMAGIPVEEISETWFDNT